MPDKDPFRRADIQHHSLIQKAAAPDLAIIVPTYNEAANIAELLARLGRVLDGFAYEVIVVDDNSPDGTADIVRAQSRADPRMRCLQRVGRRGLSAAVLEGMLATSAPVSAVIDGDLQHDEALLPVMFRTLRETNGDVIVGSRYAEGGNTGDWSGARERSSRLATALARRFTGVALTDPMSGFFMLRTDIVRQRIAHLSGAGYKILLDILTTPGPDLRVAEMPYGFRARNAGQSKLDSKVLLDFFELLLEKSAGRFVPVKFVMFCLVGGLGLIVHMAVLTVLFRGLGAGFVAAQAVATGVAMTVNFFVNNVFTYADRRIRGWKLLPGWLSFCAASSVGALANVGVASYLYSSLSAVWYASAIAGIIVGAAWNYAVTALYTWKQ